jgi:hypothetical protein
MGELETCLAVLFKRKGKNILSEKEFVFSASIDYRWLTPKEAQDLLELGVSRGLLVRTEGFIKPGFDFKEMEVPLSFRPSKEVLKEKQEEASLFARILERISSKSGLKKREVVARINRQQEKLGVDVEVAGLVIANDLNIEVRDLYEPVKAEILER